MKEYIYKLREKPDHIKQQYLVFVMFVSMSFVVAVWIYGFTVRTEDEVSFSDKISSDIKPFSLFSQTIKNTYNSMTASSGDAIDQLSKIKERAADPHQGQKMIPLTVINKQ